MFDTSGSMAFTTAALDSNCSFANTTPECYPNLNDSDLENDRSRMDIARSVIKDIVNNSALVGKANFGLLEWNSAWSENLSTYDCNFLNPYYTGALKPYREKLCGETLKVKISQSGASDIIKLVDDLMVGGSTKLDAAMIAAKEYLYSAESPVKKNLSCQKNIVILISDGNWTGSTADAIVADFNANNIKTYVVGFSAGATNVNNYNNLAKAGGTTAPFFAKNSKELYDALNRAITAATEIPQTLQQVSSKDALIKSSFLPLNDHQWKGYLKRQKIEAGKFVDLWEAGALLNTRAHSDRKIWTVNNNLELSIDNFKSTNAITLGSLIYEDLTLQSDTARISKLINFVRGDDAYGEFGGSRWKLTDIYHSKPLLVEAPIQEYSSQRTNTESYYRGLNGYAGFRSQWKARRGVVYVGSNGGMLHAFDSLSGQELWSFVPPPVLNKLRNMESANVAMTNTIYTVDGSPQVEDIFYKGAWHTVLICGLGRGGRAYFALDITDPDRPFHLYSFENDAINSKVHYWDASGAKTSYTYTQLSGQPGFDYSRLGEAFSEPVFTLMPNEGSMRWVFVIGGGYYGLTKTSQKAVVSVVDAESGRIIKSIDLPDYASANFANGVTSQVSKMSPDSFLSLGSSGSLIYFTDLQGKLWKLNLSNSGDLFHIEQVLNAGATLANDRLTFNKVAAFNLKGKALNFFFGTGNLFDATRSSDAIKNRLFSVKDNDFPGTRNLLGTYPLTLDQAIPDLTATSAQCASSLERGWYLNLESFKDTTGISLGKNWRALNTPVIYQQKIYLEVYQPDQANSCGGGVTRLVVIDMCGKTMVSSKIIAGVANQIFFYKGQLFLTTNNDELVNVRQIQDVKKFTLAPQSSVKYKTRVH
jgi:type IV pilus assembly protein PilY1